MMEAPLSKDQIAAHNAERLAVIEEDYAHLGKKLARKSIRIDNLKKRVKALELATPTWGAGVGGTRFAKFPIPGEPTNIDEKLEDCAVVQQLCRVTPRLAGTSPDCARHALIAARRGPPG